MSQDPMAGMAGGQGQPSEEELRAYVAEMRSAHAGEIVAQVVSVLLNGAQVKLGRDDARLLLDIAANVNDQAGEHLDEQFTSQVSDVVNQLRMAQVEAEKELKELQAQGQVPPEQNDLGTPMPTGPAEGEPSQAQTPPQPPQQQAPQQPQTPPQQGGQGGSRLWTPGG